jgi:hypothetical protein
MTTWATFLGDVREDMQDAGTTTRWSNGQLYLYAKDAIRDYSIWFPRRIDRLGLVLIDGSVALPSDYIEDIQVEYPLNSLLDKRIFRPGFKYREGSPSQYFMQGGNLYVNELVDETIYLTYSAAHAIPASAIDDTFELSVPDADLELLRIYIKGKAYSQMRSRSAALDRFKPVGARDDNPLAPETDDLMEVYSRMIAERTTGGVIVLYRLGR